MDKNKKRNLIITAVIAVILVIVLLVVWLMKGDSPSMGNNVITEPPRPTITIGGNITNIPNISATPSVEPTIEVEPTTVPTIPVAPTIEPTITVAPTVVPTITVVPTEVPTITVAPTVEPTITVEPTVEPTITVEPTVEPTITVAPTATPSPSPVPTSTPTPSPRPTSTPTPKPTATPTPSPSPKPTSTPTPTEKPVENDGGMLNWNDTVTLDKIGASMPVLDSFNDLALKDGNAWFGDVNSPSYDIDKANDILYAFDDVRYALEDKGVIGSDANAFTLTDTSLTFHYSGWGATGDLELIRSNNYYIVNINTPLDKDVFTGKDVAPYSREILVAMLTMISSTPEELEDYMYTGLYEDAKVLTTKSFTSVGDAKVKFNDVDSYKNHFVFYITAQ